MVSTPSDRPTPSELIEAVREYLERDVMTIEGRTGFHARVARNALAMIQRDLDLGSDLESQCKDQVYSLLGNASDGASLHELEAELVRAIRAGEFDDRLSDVAAYARASVAAKLRISNPDYFVEQS